MSSLLSDSEMAAIQGVALSGMKTSVAIYHGANTRTDNGNEWGYPATPDLTVLGWLHEITSQTTNLGVADGRTTLSEVFRLFLPVGTDCRTGDKVVIAGISYYVQHTNDGETYPAALTVALRLTE